MVERVIIPVLDGSGKASQLSPHFGRAPYFAIAEITPKGEIESLNFQSNRSEHFGGQGRPPNLLLQLRPHVIITFGMGPRAMRRFQDAGVAVMQAQSEILGDVLNAFVQNELTELTEGCRDARYP
ncbi:MAG: NifB/NifX family molybdenum-iron cluster-binding protein [Candidatus Hermodarchaeia archaeon]|jgi:predicted Fe-Mo cluster-binding NifX family protein